MKDWDVEEIQLLGSLTSEGRVSQLYDFYFDIMAGKGLVDRQHHFEDFKSKLSSLYNELSDQHQESIRKYQLEKMKLQQETDSHFIKVERKANSDPDQKVFLKNYLLNMRLFKVFDELLTPNFVIATKDEL